VSPLGVRGYRKPRTMTLHATISHALVERIMPAGHDPDDVRRALEMARAALQSGDLREALRWLRRAAETAADHGLDLRAVQLAKAASELRSELDLPPTVPPPAETGATAPATTARALATTPSVLPHSYGEPPQRFVDTSPGLSPKYDARASSAAPPAEERSTDPHPRPFDRSAAALSALRVAVEHMEDGRLKISVLGPGQELPRDAYEAVLVALSPEAVL